MMCSPSARCSGIIEGFISPRRSGEDQVRLGALTGLRFIPMLLAGREGWEKV